MNHAPNQNDWSAAYTSLSGSWAPNIQNATVNGHMHNDVSSDSAISHAYDVPQVSLHGNLAYTTGQALSPQTHNGRTTPSTMVPMTPDMQHFNSYLSHDYPASHSHNLNPYSFPCQAMVPTAAANPWADAAYTLGTQIRAADHNRRISPAHEYQSPQLCPQLPRPVPDHHSANAYSHHDLSSNQVNTAQYEPTTTSHASMFAQAWLPVSAPAFPTTTSSSLTAPVITETQPSIKSSHMESVANAILRLTERTKQTVQQEQSVQPAHEIPPTPPGLASASSSSSSWMSSSSQLAEISSSGSLVTAQLIDSVPSTPVASTSGTRTEESMGKDLGWLDTIHENLEIGSDGRPRKQRRMKGEPPRDLAQRRYACDLCTDEPRLFARPSALKIHMLTHTKEKPHICPTCNRAFAIASNLKRHQRLHLAQLIDPDGVVGSKIKIRALNEAGQQLQQQQQQQQPQGTLTTAGSTTVISNHADLTSTTMTHQTQPWQQRGPPDATFIDLATESM